MKNTILTFGIVLSMLFAMPALPVHAEIINSGACGENLTWTLDDSGNLTISGTGEMWNYDSFNRASWESLRSSITSVLIENGVTSLDAIALDRCKNLTKITIPGSLTSIESLDTLNWNSADALSEIIVSENNIFYSSQDGVLFNKNKTELIFCPQGKSGIYSIPYGVTKIDAEAFIDSSLTTVIIPESITSIDSCSFFRCGMKSITIPKSVTNIGAEAFWWSNLRTINVSDENTKYSSYDGCLYDKEKNTFILCPPAKESCTILTGTTKIDYSAFFDCYGLKTLSIPNSVTSIGRFFGSDSLTDIYFHGGEMEWLNILRNGESDFNSYYRERCLQIPRVHFDYRGKTLTLNEGETFKINGKTITGEKINFDGNGKMYLDSGYTAKIERDHSETATTQGFMACLTNPKDTVTMVLEVTGTANDVDYTGRTITQRFDFSGYEIEGLVNFGLTVSNIPKPLSLTLKSIE